MHGHVAAPALREVAEIWWDRDVDPVVTWSEASGEAVFRLRPPDGPGEVIELLRLPSAEVDGRRIAEVLAEGLAACDFPPTEPLASPGRVAATLRAAGLGDVLS